MDPLEIQGHEAVGDDDGAGGGDRGHDSDDPAVVVDLVVNAAREGLTVNPDAVAARNDEHVGQLDSVHRVRGKHRQLAEPAPSNDGVRVRRRREQTQEEQNGEDRAHGAGPTHPPRTRSRICHACRTRHARANPSVLRHQRHRQSLSAARARSRRQVRLARPRDSVQWQ